MKPSRVILLNVLFFSVIACANKEPYNDEKINQTNPAAIATIENVPDSFPTRKILAHVYCKGDVTQSYALYIPSAKTNAVMYFFDPHGDGSLPLKKYKALADAYNFVLIGSNNSRNGNDWQTTENVWQALFNDTQNKLALSKNRIYACGFSGGAKVASYIALHHSEVKAVIAGGAGLPDQTPAGNFSFSFTGIAGRGDMNMTDLVSLNNDFDKTQTKHRLLLFDGKHEWAPENVMEAAFAGLQFDAMRDRTIPKSDSLIKVFIANSKNRIDMATNKNDWIQASNECVLSISMLHGVADAAWFKEKNNSIINNAAYKNQSQEQQRLFLIENNKKSEYNTQFQQGNINYWTKTIDDLNARAKTSTPEAAMYQRLLAYLSLAFYSISSQFINNNQNSEATYFVTLYKQVDPGNSEAWYFSAIINARNGNSKLTADDLSKAADNGFNDKNRMIQQPEFQTLQPPVNFAAIEARMK